MSQQEILSKGEQTRTAIMEAACKLFIRNGYHATSMREIANEAGIVQGGIYNHFENKEAIFDAVFLLYHPYQVVLNAIEQAPAKDVEAFINYVSDVLIQEINRRPEFLKLIFIEIVEFNSLHMAKLLARLLPAEMSIIQNVIKENYQDIRDDIPIPIFVRAFISMVLGYQITNMVVGNSSEIPDAFRLKAKEYIVDIFLHGVRKGKSE